jgi:hypothetical protein
MGTICFTGTSGLCSRHYYQWKSRNDEGKGIADRFFRSHGTEVKTEYKFGLGLLVSIISGVLSACFNFGLEAGKPMAIIANDLWKEANPGQGEFLFQNNVTYVVVLWGGMATNLIGCLYLSFKNKSYTDYKKKMYLL